MICITDCSECKNRLPKIDGWLACCKAFPNGFPKDFDYRNLKERGECNNGIGFEPIVEKNVYIISGAVGSGKTTYVQNHMKQGDLVVDLDYICAALGATSELYNDHKPYLDIALAVRETVFQKIIKREGDWDNAFVITASKDMNKVRELAKTLDGKIVKMKATKEQCIANVRADSRRAENIELHLKLIEEWFDSNQ